MAAGTPELASVLAIALAKSLGGVTTSTTGYADSLAELARSDVAYRTVAGVYNQGVGEFHDVKSAVMLRLVRGTRPTLAVPTDEYVDANAAATINPIVLQTDPNTRSIYLPAPRKTKVDIGGTIAWARVSSVETPERWVDLSVGTVGSGAEVIIDATTVSTGSELVVSDLSIYFEV